MPEDATKRFFERLGQRQGELFGTASGTLRVELEDGAHTERWLVSVAEGNVVVSRRSGRADCTVRAPRKLFDRVVRGEVNAMAAVLRGEMAVEGDSKILIRFQRLFPSPPTGRATKSRKTKR